MTSAPQKCQGREKQEKLKTWSQPRGDSWDRMAKCNVKSCIASWDTEKRNFNGKSGGFQRNMESW